jgi:hypothetical protein
MVEAYSHQMSSAGFWPDRAEESVFYAYAYRSRTGSATIPWPRLMRSTATSSTSSCWPMTRFAPPRTPTRVLPEFLQTTYEGAAELGRWIGGRSRTTRRSARDRDEATAMTTGLAALPDDVLDRIACASVVEAMGQLHSHRAHILSLVSPAPRRLFGPVATIAYLPTSRRPKLGFGALFHQAIAESPAGTVLVLSSGGYPDASHGGGTKLSRLQHTGAAGVLADGRLRDFEQLGEYCVCDLVSGRRHALGRRYGHALRRQHRRGDRRRLRWFPATTCTPTPAARS